MLCGLDQRSNSIVVYLIQESDRPSQDDEQRVRGGERRQRAKQLRVSDNRSTTVVLTAYVPQECTET